MLRSRLLFGPLMIVVLLAACWLDEWLNGVGIPAWLSPLLGARDTLPPGVVTFLILAAACVLAGNELSAMLRAKGIAASRWLNPALALLGLFIAGLMPQSLSGVAGSAVTGTGVGVVLVGSLAYYSRTQRVEGSIAAAGGALLAFAYLGILLGFVLLIRREHSTWVLLWVILTTKSCDIGAFFTGRAIGRHKLAPWLSPGKTWEGLVGGMLFSGVIGAVGLVLLENAGVRFGARGSEVTHSTGVLLAWGGWIGVLFGLAGQFGDLLASLLKRDAGAKDSGRLLPGFGGVLDIIDSVVLVAPLAYWLLRVGIPLG